MSVSEDCSLNAVLYFIGLLEGMQKLLLFISWEKRLDLISSSVSDDYGKNVWFYFLKI